MIWRPVTQGAWPRHRLGPVGCGSGALAGGREQGEQQWNRVTGGATQADAEATVGFAYRDVAARVEGAGQVLLEAIDAQAGVERGAHALAEVVGEADAFGGLHDCVGIRV